jgi:hypothetical protein
MTFFISFFFVWIRAQPGIQSRHTKRFGVACGSWQSVLASHSVQTILQCLQPGLLGPGTHHSSHLLPQQVISVFFSSSTSRQTFPQLDSQPQCAQQPFPARERSIPVAKISKNSGATIASFWRIGITQVKLR